MKENNSPQLPDKGKDLARERHIVSQGSFFSGPLPPPAVLEQYNRIVSGAAERIIKMVENQSSHRQRLESRVIKTDNAKSILGLIFAFIVSLLGLSLGAYTALQGSPLFGGAVSIGVLVSIVTAFIVGSKRRQRILERRE